LFPKIGGLQNIEILNITATGRVKNVKLFGAFGSYQMSGVDLRKRLKQMIKIIKYN